MNSVEKLKLSDYRISHLSKSLYVFYLTDLVQKGINVIDLASAASYLFSNSQSFPTNANLETAVLCLDELEKFSLIKKVKQTDNWQGCTFTLPLYSVQVEGNVPSRAFTLDDKWTPSENFKNSALLCGLEDYSYTQTELKSFISYWNNRQEFRNQSGWERTFATRLLRQRQTRVKKDFNNQDNLKNTKVNTQNSGSQIHATEGAILGSASSFVLNSSFNPSLNENLKNSITALNQGFNASSNIDHDCFNTTDNLSFATDNKKINKDTQKESTDSAHSISVPFLSDTNSAITNSAPFLSNSYSQSKSVKTNIAPERKEEIDILGKMFKNEEK